MTAASQSGPRSRPGRVATPPIRYPTGLPVSEKRDEILAAIRDHQVVVVAGETGSGKSTQLPKICLELGRGGDGLIGHTQPRRLAARSVAERIAEELEVPLGGLVGYSVRFTDQVSADTRVRVMTDGIVLAEVQRDQQLRRYDTLIIDEAHERSLNVDFLLGYVKRLLPRRPDLKVIITSATIDTERFATHFGGAPVIEVSGRVYPVEVRYRPLLDEIRARQRDQVEAITDAVEELGREGPGDILVFLSGEREIRDAADALRRLQLPATELLPLYARLSAADQHRVFAPHSGRRIVLATNVAETSLTVPGIRYVIDPGTARISRYNRRTKVQRLPIEAISQASANQRAGRCGRVAPGICIRLYGEDDFESRPEFTEPEIQRTNLASVILQMAAIGLGDVADFPFLDPPDSRSINDGIALLEELGAFDRSSTAPHKRLTRLGRRLARLPLDPRLGRMVLEADREGCSREVMIIASALAIQDPRERPIEARQDADALHQRFSDPDSDFLAYRNLWDHLQEQQRVLSGNQFRKLCRTEHLHYLRIREWQDIYRQLRQVARSLGIGINREPADRDAIHRALLAGLLSHIGWREAASSEVASKEVASKEVASKEYWGARNARFMLSPGSALAVRPPRWVMAAELVETNRMWAHTAARMQPGWAERLGAHLVTRTYHEPHWDPDRGQAMAHEKVTLYGLVLVAARRIGLGRVDPDLARELFIQHALIHGEWQTRHEFFHRNRALVEEVRALEDRVRQRGILADEEVRYDFYSGRIDRTVVSARHFDRWWSEERATRPHLLDFTVELLVDGAAGPIRLADYPDEWHHGELVLPLSYEFNPGSPTDGVSVDIPLVMLNQVRAPGFDWQVPGHRPDLVTGLIRSLPKPVRRQLVPVAEHARAFLSHATPEAGPLLEQLGMYLSRVAGAPVSPSDFDLDRVPDHLRVTFRAVDEHGRIVDADKDLDSLTERLRGRVRAAVGRAGEALERTGLRAWTFGALSAVVEVAVGALDVTAYPALIDDGDSVAVRVLPSEQEQHQAMWAGTRRLLLLTIPSPRRDLRDRLTDRTKLALTHAPHGTAAELLDDCITCAVDHLLAVHGGPVWDADSFVRLRAAVAAEVGDRAVGVVAAVGRIVDAARRAGETAQAMRSPVLAPAVADVRRQLGRLVYPGFVTATGARRLPDVLRYVRAIEHRLAKLSENPERDRELMEVIERLEQEHQDRMSSSSLHAGAGPGRVRWMLEELRVSLFAQHLGTAERVSEQRVRRELDLTS